MVDRASDEVDSGTSKYAGGRMRRFFWLLFAVLVALAVPSLARAEQDGAVAAGEAWLQLIDSGAYAQSWKQASQMFRSTVDEPKWEESVKAARGQFGLLKARNLKSVKHDSDYTVINFQCDFEKKSQAIETLTLVKEDGRWEATAYLIR